MDSLFLIGLPVIVDDDGIAIEGPNNTDAVDETLAICYSQEEHNGILIGSHAKTSSVVVTIDTDQARRIGAALIDLANQIDRDNA